MDNEDSEVLASSSDRIYEWTKVATKRTISYAELMGLVNPEFFVSEELDKMVVGLQAYMLSDHLEDQTIVREKIAKTLVPATWWDYFKFTYKGKWWFPSWLKPIRKTIIEEKVKFEVIVESRLIFPEANVPTPAMLGRSFKSVNVRVKDD